MEEFVFVTWGLGPSYRYRIKQFIKFNRTTQSCKDVRYLIFTDKPSDFDYLRNQTEIPIIDIINIFDFIKSKGIELAHNEYLPNVPDDQWAEEWRQRRGEFSYPAKRVILLKLHELGLTKFALIDPDVYVNKTITKEQLHQGLNIPPDSVSVMGRVQARVKWSDECQALRVESPRSMDGGTFMDFYRAAYFLLYMIRERVQQKYEYDIPFKVFNHYHTLDLSEGIFHYYHFSSLDKLMEYYHVWDETVRFLYSTEYRSVTVGPGWLIPDFTVLCLTNILCGITSYDADRPIELFYGMVFFEDKYMMPSWNGIWPGNTLQDFANINKEPLNQYYLNRSPRDGLWHFLRDYNILDMELYNNFLQKHPQFKEECPEYYDGSWLLDVTK